MSNHSRSFHRRAAMGAQNPLLRTIHLSPGDGGGGAGGDDEAGVALEELRALDIKITDEDSVERAMHKIQSRVNRLVKTYGNINEERKNLEQQLRDAVERAKNAEEIAKAAKAQGPQLNLNEGVMRSLVTRLEAPKGVDQRYFNVIAFDPEEISAARSILGDAFGDVLSNRAKGVATKLSGVSDSVARHIREAQAINDILLIADVAMVARGDTDYANISGSRIKRIQSLGLYSDWKRLTMEIQRAMDTATTGEGKEWVPTQMSANLKLLIQAQLKVAGLFDEITMPTPTYDWPVEGADAVAYFVGESTADTETTNVIPPTTPKTAKIIFTAKKHAVRVLYSSEVSEDSIINIAQDTVRRISKAVRRAIENAIVNGDTTIGTGSAQDFDIQGAGFLQDHRKAWEGLRKKALISNMPNVDCATLNTANLLNIRKAMGVYGSDSTQLAWLVGFSALIQMTQITEVMTVDKYGQFATVLNGELAKFFNSPVILSEFVREDVAATGVNTSGGPNTKTTVLCANRECFLNGERRTMTINRSDQRHIETDQTVVVGTRRGDFQECFPTASAANKIVGIGRNIAS